MRISSWLLRMGLNLYPPLFYQGISVKHISKNYQEIDVALRKALFNRNLAFTAFGGSIFSAADPFYSTMYWQIFSHQNIDCESWLKAAHIQYIRPGHSRLSYQFRISDEDIQIVTKDLLEYGKTERWHKVEAIDKKGKLCAEVDLLCYIRLRK